MSDWQETKNGLTKVFVFEDFVRAIEFVNQVAHMAQSENHHPDILIHSSNQVKITLFTHDEGQISCKDYSLSKLIDSLILGNP